MGSGGWKAKDFTFEDGKWVTKAWGVTNTVNERPRFNESEARVVAKRLGREIRLDANGKTWKIFLENDQEDFMRAWLVLQNEV